ncbi:Ig-like domain-containing protein, partial [Rufibacter glacialis]
MKKLYTSTVLPLYRILLLLLLTTTAALAQKIGNDAFLKGQYLEVGVSRAGSFGTETAAPSGYHANSSGGFLGFVADPAKDGWDVGTPAHNGDYFVPGTPEEGWGIEINGTNYFNSALMSSFGVPGSITDYTNTGSEVSATWSGAVAGLSVSQRTFFPTNGLYFVMQVTIRNTTSSPMPNVFYMRNVDPDNEQPWTGDFDTRNTVVYQPTFAPCNEALVEAVGLTYGQYLGLGTKDSRARVTYGGFSNRDASAVWTGDGFAQSGTNEADEAISLAYNFGTLAPGQEITFSYAYVLDRSQLNTALEATAEPYIFANGTDITATGVYRTETVAPVTLEIKNVSGYTWTWEPATDLNTTTGSTVIATPTTTRTYKVTGTPTSGSGGGCGSGSGIITRNISIVVNAVRAIRLSFPNGFVANVGSEYCVLATATDIDGQPVAGAQIDFSVTRTNVLSGSAITGPDGVARFCYIGTKAGTDLIVASVGGVGAGGGLTWIFDKVTIDFPPIPDKLTTSPPFTVTATASPDLPVMLSIVSGPATISGNTITLTGMEGTVVVSASAGAMSVTRSFLVTSAPTPVTCANTGGITYEFWAGASPRAVEVDQLPAGTAPTSTSTLSSFSAPANVAENYFAR